MYTETLFEHKHLELNYKARSIKMEEKELKRDGGFHKTEGIKRLKSCILSLAVTRKECAKDRREWRRIVGGAT